MPHTHPSDHPHHDDFADRLDLESTFVAPVTGAALDAAAAALGRSPAVVVDLGAGTGVGSLALASRFPGATVHSIDVSADMLERVQAAALAAGVADRVNCHLADLDQGLPPGIPAAVDLVWASLSLHHLADPRAALRQISAVMQPGAVVVVTEMDGVPVFTPADLDSGRPGLGDRLADALVDSGYPAAVDWTDLLAESGFRMMRHYRDAVVISGDSGLRYLAMQLDAWRGRLADALGAEDAAALGAVISRLESGVATLTERSGRVVWIAARPTTSR